MKIVKGILIVCAGVGVLTLGSCVLVGSFIMSGEDIQLTEADLTVGGAYPETERAEMLSACSQMLKSSKKADTPATCDCVASQAGTQLSRYERIIMAGTLKGEFSVLASSTRALLAMNMDPDRLRQMTSASKDQNRMAALFSSCGITKTASKR